MFLGTYILTFSGKGRVILPKKFRLELHGSEVVMMKGMDGGLWGFSASGWEEFSKNQLGVPVTNEEGRRLRRKFFPNAEKCELDIQGRFVIPELLLKSSLLKEKMVLIGAGDHFEIWNNDAWLKMVNKGELEE